MKDSKLVEPLLFSSLFIIGSSLIPTVLAVRTECAINALKARNTAGDSYVSFELRKLNPGPGPFFDDVTRGGDSMADLQDRLYIEAGTALSMLVLGVVLGGVGYAIASRGQWKFQFFK